MESPTSPYEVRCSRCDVTFPIGTRQCIHCGGAISGRGTGGLLENLSDADFETADDGSISIERTSGEMPGEFDASRPIRVRVRANDVSLSLTEASDTSILNKLPAEVEAIEDDSPHSVLVRLRCGNEPLLARITRRSLAELGVEAGDRVIAQIKSVSVRSGRT